MAKAQMDGLVPQLRRAATLQATADQSDGQLLGRFVVIGDEAAFEALVRRHGPMVLGVCRRVLQNHHDAEDAFQAAFLVLARKAASVVPRDKVGNWLHGVAYRTALEAKAAAARRRAKEHQVLPRLQGNEATEHTEDDWLALFDQELQRLPPKYREPVVLCDLEGKTHKAAARQLGCPEGTLSTRLATARRRLAARLARRGVTLTTAALATTVAPNAAAASVPASLLASTVKAAPLFAAGTGAMALTMSAQAVALAEGVLKAMYVQKLRNLLVTLFILAMFGTVAGLMAHSAIISDQNSVPALQPAGNGQDKDVPKVDQAWDKAWEVDPWFLKNDTVHKDIKASTDQVKQVGTLVQDLRKKHQAVLQQAIKDAAGGNTAKANDAFQKVEAEFAKAVNQNLPKIFKPEQVKRLKQIDVQWRVPATFQLPTTVKVLKLSAKQVKDIGDIVQATQQQITDGKFDVIPMGMDADKVRSIYEMATKKFVATLSKEQQQMWQEMTGPHIPIEFTQDDLTDDLVPPSP